MEVMMERCNIPFLKKAFIAFLIIAGMLSATILCEAQGGKAYISTQDATKMLVFNLANHQLIKSIDIYTPTPLAQILPPNPNDVIAVGDRIFMTVPGSEISKAGINEIKVIDSLSDLVVATIKTDMTPSGLLEYKGRVYVVNRYGNTIQEIDPDSLKIVRTIPFTAPGKVPLNNPLTMEIANDKIYLPYPGDLARPGIIQVLNLKTGTLLKVIEFNTVSPDGPLAIKKVSEGKIYLGGNRSVGVLDTQSDRITRSITLSSREINVQSFAICGDKVYTANGMSTTSVIDTQSDTLLTEIDTGYHYYASHLKAGIAAAGNKIFIADAGRGIKIIDARQNKLILTIVSDEPLGPVAIIGSK
jgi:DNA-binding beta-propeller fold protein YncE